MTTINVDGLAVSVDLDDLSRVRAQDWLICPYDLHKKRIRIRAEIDGKMTTLHRFVMQAAPGTQVHTVNRMSFLNYSKQNFRVVTA